jgi:Flp pilus assembly protein TadG
LTVRPRGAKPRRAAIRARREDGQAIVEVALAMPVLLILITAILQFAPMYSTYSALVDAGRAGVRQLSIGRGLSNPCDPAVQAAVASMAGSSTLPTADVTPSFTSESATNTTPDFCGSTNGTTGCAYVYATSCNTNGNENENDEATITVSEPYTLRVFGMGVMTVQLTTSSSEAVE